MVVVAANLESGSGEVLALSLSSFGAFEPARKAPSQKTHKKG